VAVLSTRLACATCGEDCDSEYASAIDDCKSLCGDYPAGADDLTTCIRAARDDPVASGLVASLAHPRQERRRGIQGAGVSVISATPAATFNPRLASMLSG